MKYNSYNVVINNERIKGMYTTQEGKSNVFAKSKRVFKSESFGRIKKNEEPRQKYFENQLYLMSEELGSKSIPVFFILNRNELRLDKGCIGHAIANDIIRHPQNNAEGFVEFVELK